MMQFPVVLHKDEASDFGVTVPDLPGCFSAGETVDEALANAAEAIEIHIEGLLVGGESWPEPQPIEAHRSNPNFADGIWAYATVDVSRLVGRVRRVNITVPERLLKLMDAYAVEQGQTRSGLIAEATIAYIARKRANNI